MVHSLPTNAGRSSTGSWLDAWRRRRQRHPAAFTCGVRVVEGELPGERSRWTFRDSAVDVHASGETVALNHGTGVTLHLRFAEPVDMLDLPTRTNHVVLPAVEVVTGARVQVSLPLGELATVGVRPRE